MCLCAERWQTLLHVLHSTENRACSFFFHKGQRTSVQHTSVSGSSWNTCIQSLADTYWSKQVSESGVNGPLRGYCAVFPSTSTKYVYWPDMTKMNFFSGTSSRCYCKWDNKLTINKCNKKQGELVSRVHILRIQYPGLHFTPSDWWYKQTFTHHEKEVLICTTLRAIVCIDHEKHAVSIVVFGEALPEGQLNDEWHGAIK